jgi:uncharacterized protein
LFEPLATGGFLCAPMVSANVSKLLLSGPGAVREFEFAESIPDPEQELHLHGPIRGYVRMTRTSEGILVHSDHVVSVSLECARCLDDSLCEVAGELDEEFLPSTDIKTGLPLPLPSDDLDYSLIDEHHEINLNEVLRQNILTSLPLRPLCGDDCPGLCSTCGERLDRGHPRHRESDAEDDRAEPDRTSPFAGLAVLLQDDHER